MKESKDQLGRCKWLTKKKFNPLLFFETSHSLFFEFVLVFQSICNHRNFGVFGQRIQDVHQTNRQNVSAIIM
jgi:hypothetical protein